MKSSPYIVGIPCFQRMLIIVLKLYKINISYKAYFQAVYVQIEDLLSMEHRLNTFQVAILEGWALADQGQI